MSPTGDFQWAIVIMQYQMCHSYHAIPNVHVVQIMQYQIGHSYHAIPNVHVVQIMQTKYKSQLIMQ